MKKTAKAKPGKILVNQLTVADAQHLFRVEGGAITRSDVIFQLVSICTVSGFLARAILLGQVTIWHLFLPMIAEYFAYLVALPVIQIFVRHPELKKVSWQCLRIIAIETGVVVVAGLVWPQMTGKGMTGQWSEGWTVARNWIVGSGMHWPILLAAIYSAVNVNRNVRKLIEVGPPFMGPGMGCAMRILVFFFAGVALPVFGMVFAGVLKDFHPSLKISPDSMPVVWLVWSLLLISELCTLWMRWDIQNRLQRSGKLPDA